MVSRGSFGYFVGGVGFVGNVGFASGGLAGAGVGGGGVDVVVCFCKR